MAVGLFSGGIQEGYNGAMGQEYNHEESSFITIFVSVSLITAYCVFKYFTYDGDREFEEENKWISENFPLNVVWISRFTISQTGIAKDPCDQNEFVQGLAMGTIHAYP